MFEDLKSEPQAWIEIPLQKRKRQRDISCKNKTNRWKDP